MSKSSTSEKVFVKITSDFPLLIKNVVQSVDYLNNVLAEQTDYAIYIEVIEDGLLYIYKDFETMKLMNNPDKPFVITSLPQQPVPELEEEYLFFMGELIKESNFPLKGVKLRFEAVSGPIKKMLVVFREFIEKHQKGGYSISQIFEKTISVHFTTFKALQDYARNVQRLFVANL